MKLQLDKELTVRLVNNDMEAFNALYWKYHSPVYANALKLLKDPDTAQDIVQEVFIKLWEKRNTIDPGQEVSAWLFVVSHHLCIDQLKKQLKAALNQQAYTEVYQLAHDDTAQLEQARLEVLQEAMEQLSPQKRKVFQLCKVEGKTYEKAANELQISKYTVKEYLSDAVSVIKNYVQKHPEHTFLLLGFSVLVD